MKVFFGILAGLIAYSIVGKLLLDLLQVSWTDYALHSIDKSYTLKMLLIRQLVGILASIAVGITTTIKTNDNRKIIWLVGTIIFCTGSYVHFLTKTWTEYPVWYHFAYVLLIIPVIGFTHYFIERKHKKNSE